MGISEYLVGGVAALTVVAVLFPLHVSGVAIAVFWFGVVIGRKQKC